MIIPNKPMLFRHKICLSSHRRMSVGWYHDKVPVDSVSDMRGGAQP